MKALPLCTVLLLAALAGCAEDRDPRAVPEDTTAPSSPDGEQTGPRSAEPSTTTSTPPPRGSGTTLRAMASDVGNVLFDSTGQAVYLFDVETTDEPRCYGSCAEAWPPVLTDGAPVAGAQVRASLLGTTERTDGTTQVTYGGHPLYFYAHEGKGEVKCHDIFLNGGLWYAVQPDGLRAP